MAVAKYFIPDYQSGITRSQLRRMRKQQKLEIMEAWFRQNFEDPVHRTPYISREGGYQYIHGGPYDAYEELSTEFGGIVSENLITELVTILEREAHEWTSTPNDGDYDQEGFYDEIAIPEDPLDEIVAAIERGFQPAYGTVERLQRQELIAKIVNLEAVLNQPFEPRGMMGHNRPPEPISPIAAGDARELSSATEAIGHELKKSEPDLNTVVNTALRYRTFLKKMGAWIVAKGDSGADAFVKAVGTTAGVAFTAAALGLVSQVSDTAAAIVHAVSTTYQSLISWLSTVALPF